MPLRALLIFPILVLCLSCASKQVPSSSSARTAASGQPLHNYYDFEDVLVPKGMEIEPDESVFFETPQFKAGVLVFSGRVDPVSLFDFFVINMPKDNWSLRSYFKYTKNILVFEKPQKDCIISIVEHTTTTSLQVWVIPRSGQEEPMSGPAPAAPLTF